LIRRSVLPDIRIVLFRNIALYLKKIKNRCPSQDLSGHYNFIDFLIDLLELRLNRKSFFMN